MKDNMKSKNNTKRTFNKVIMGASVVALSSSLALGTVLAKTYVPDKDDKDDETYKEYTAKALEVQMQDIMAFGSYDGLDDLYGDDFFLVGESDDTYLDDGFIDDGFLGEGLYDDDEFGMNPDYTVDIRQVVMVAKLKVNHIQEDGSVDYLKNLPEVSLMDNSGNVIDYGTVYTAKEELGESLEAEDVYFVYFTNVCPEYDTQYNMIVTILDNDDTTCISKKVTYDGNLFYYPGATYNLVGESIHNILSMMFTEATTARDYSRGDIDMNGELNKEDALAIIEISNLNRDSYGSIELADYNGDGVIDIYDAKELMHTIDQTYIEGNISKSGTLDATDASIVLDITRQDNASLDNLLYADMNNDGVLDAIDASIILDNVRKGK